MLLISLCRSLEDQGSGYSLRVSKVKNFGKLDKFGGSFETNQIQAVHWAEGLTEIYWKLKKKEEKPNRVFFYPQLTENTKKNRTINQNNKTIENRIIKKLKKYVNIYPNHSHWIYWVPGRSQGLLYEHLCYSFIHWLIHSSFSAQSYTAPPRPNGSR